MVKKEEEEQMKGLNKPWNCQIEIVRGCNLRCDFCGIHTIPSEKKFMDKLTYMSALTNLKVFDPIRLEFAMRGEPTLHPDLLQMTAVARSFLPQSQITLTTNGIKLSKQLAIEWFKHGGNIIVVDCYNNTFDKYIERFKGLPIYDFHAGEFNPWHRHSNKTKALVVVEDIGAARGKAQRVILNQAGNVDWDRVKKYGLEPLKEPLNKKCVHPFREIAVFVDGSVSLCCRDWGQEAVLFNVNKADLYHEWYHNEKWEYARGLLYRGDRGGINICRRCDFHGGFRQGFLPKEYGNV